MSFLENSTSTVIPQSLNQANLPIAATVDLSNCDREPIHIPGSIQPHGVLLVLSEADLMIVQVSSTVDQWLGRSPEELLNQSLKTLLNSEQIASIEGCLSQDFESINPLRIVIEVKGKDSVFDGVLHRFDQSLILELEPTLDERVADFFGFHRLVKSAISRMQQATTLDQMSQIIVQEVRKLTGLDRVMVYQFDPENAGTIIAEDKRDDLTPYLGLRYPASDIPKQANQLYKLNWLRLIPTVDYTPAELIPTLNPLTQHSTDLSLAVLRSVSPVHLEYLHNMGVGASMSISLIQDKRLWGLIACHHDCDRFVSYEIRTACEFLGQVMSLELVSKEANQDLDYKMKLKSIQAKFVELIPQQDDLLNGVLNAGSNLLELVDAQGAAIVWNGECHLMGNTPNTEQLDALLTWVETQLEGNLLYTSALSKDYPIAEAYKSIASGLIVLAISRVNRNYILWFRPEVVQTVNWGGDPTKPVEVSGDGEARLSPRKSFALWQETVQGRSLPWKPCELEAVLELRSAIVGIVLRQADELAKINVELERSNNELDAFAYIASHDLKEPLRGIHNYSSFLIEDYGDILNEDGVSKLKTLMNLTQRMEDLINSLLHFSRLGRVELALQRTDLNQLVQNALEVLSISLESTPVEIRIPRSLPAMRCDRVQISEVFTNLISNAIRYNDRDQKWVEIGYLDQVESPQVYADESEAVSEPTVTFYVRDNGIGIPERHLDTIFRIFKRLHASTQYGGGTGAGLTIAKKIVERHGGKLWVESTPGQGSTFYFTLKENRTQTFSIS
jgi:two-component system, chemotaxis family, sensor kinase Cph1